jgi:hypothetical protein
MLKSAIVDKSFKTKKSPLKTQEAFVKKIIRFTLAFFRPFP